MKNILFGLILLLAFLGYSKQGNSQCNAPTNASFTLINSSIVNLTWTNGGNAAGYQLEYGTAGFTLGTGISLFPGISAFTLSGLSQNTTYEYYVRQFCANADTSAWTGPISFTMPTSMNCVTTVSQFPFLTDFDNNSVSPWIQSTNDDMDWILNFGATGSSSTGPTFDYSGNGRYIYTEATGSGTGYPNKTAILESPCLDLTTSNASVKFAYNMYGSDMGTLYLEATVDEITWTTLWSKSGNQGTSWFIDSVSLQAYSNQFVKLRFRGVTGNNFRSDMAIDEIEIRSEPTNDLALLQITNPVSPLSLGIDTVKVEIENRGLSAADSFRIHWEINDTAQNPVVITSTLAASSVSEYTLGAYNFTGGSTIKTWVELLGNTDEQTNNDTLEQSFCVGLRGTITVGGSNADYTDLGAFFSDLEICGLTDSLHVNVLPNTGPYNQRIQMDGDLISGLGPNRPLYIHGNGNTLSWGGDFNNPSLLTLKGVSYVEIDSFSFSLTNTSWGIGLFITDSSHHVSVKNCSFNHPNLFNASATTTAGIAISNAENNPLGTGNLNGYNILVENCTFTSANYAILDQGGSTAAANSNRNNTYRSNTFVDFGTSGINADFSHNLTVENNEFYRNTQLNGSVTRVIDMRWCVPSTVASNYIHDLYPNSAGSQSAEGIILIDCDAQSGSENKIYNNILANFGATNNIFFMNLNDANYSQVYHNTIQIADGKVSNQITGFYLVSSSFIDFRNNILSFEKNSQAPTTRFVDLISSFGQLTFDDNVYYTGQDFPSTPTYDGLSFTQWTSNSVYDQNTVLVNPFLQPNFAPGLNSINNTASSTFVTTDFYGETRGTSADIGAVEFTPPQIDLALSEILVADSACGFSDSTQIRVLVQNLGLDSAISGALFYRLNGNQAVSDSFSINVASGQNAEVAHAVMADLSSDTTYSLQVWLAVLNDSNQVNDSLSKSIRNLVSTAVSSSSPFVENFDNFPRFDVEVFDNGWRSPDYSNAYYWTVDDFTTSTFNTGPDNDNTTGSFGNYMYTEGFGNGVNQATLVSRCLSLDNSSNLIPELEFYYHKFGSDIGDLFIEVESEGQIITLDSIVGETQTSSAAPWLSKRFDLGEFSNQEIRLQFRARSGNGSRGDIALDDVSIEMNSATCDTISIDNITSTLNEATVQVQTNLGFNGLIYEYGVVGFTPGTGIKDTVTTSSFTLSGLTAYTPYEVYVQDICSNNNLSALVGPDIFFTQDYCNSNLHGSACSNGNYGTQTISLGDFNYNATSCFSGYQFLSNSIIELQPTIDYNLSVVARGSSTPNFGVWIDLNRDGDFDDTDEFIGQSGYLSNFSFPINFDLQTPKGFYVVRVRSMNDNFVFNSESCSYKNFGETIDLLVEIGDPPSCISPSNLSAFYTSPNALELSWQESGSYTHFEVEYGVSGFAQGNGTKIITDSTTIVIPNLQAFTNYDVFVKQICTAGDTSASSGRETFNTYPYCFANLHGTGCNGTIRYDISKVELDSISNVSNNCLPGSFGNYTNLSTTLIPGNTYQLSIETSSLNSTVNYGAWIDYNRDGVFDQNTEAIGTGAFVNGKADLTVTIPANATQGASILRVRSSSSSIFNGNACSLLSFGETEDYSVSIAEQPSCLAPQNIQTTVGLNTVEFLGQNAGANESFILEYGIENFTLGTGTTISYSGASFLVTGLSAFTTYDFYLRKLCGNDTSGFYFTSLSTDPYCTTTLHFPSTCSNSNSYIQSFTAGGISNVASGCTPGGYSNNISSIQANFKAGDTVSFSITNQISSRSGIWVDFNRDGTYDLTTENVYLSSFSTTSHSGSFVIPSWVDQGLLPMRVRSTSSSLFSSSACSYLFYGETEDYGLTITPPDTCPAISAISVFEVTNNSAQLNWTQTASSQDRIVKLTNLDSNQDTIISTGLASSNFQLTGLNADTRYEVSMAQVCSAQDTSAFSSPTLFKTSCTDYCTYELELFGNFNTPWAGSFLEVYVNGFKQTYRKIEVGSANRFLLAVCEGDSVRLEWTDGFENAYYALNDNLGELEYASSFNPPNGFNHQFIATCDNCRPVSSVNISSLKSSDPVNHTGNEMTVSFFRFNTGDSVEVIVGAPGFNADTSQTRFYSTADSVLLTGLDYLRDYEIYINNICSFSDTVYQSGPFYHQVGICSTDFHGVGCGGGFNIGIDSVIINGQAFINNCNSESYHFIDPATPLLYKAGDTLNIRVVPGDQYSTGIGVYFERNQDTEFTLPDDFFAGANVVSINPFETQIIIPQTVSGRTLLRIRTEYNSPMFASEFCTFSQYGETEDYVLTIEGPCDAPNSLSIDSVGNAGALVSWNNSNGEEFEYAVYKQSESLAAATILSSTASSALLTTLDDSTAYFISLRKVCDNGALRSDWQTRAFTTLCSTPVAQINNIDTAYCEGETIETLTVLNTGKATANWFINGSSVATGNSFTPNITDTAVISVSLNNGFCSSPKLDKQIFVSTSPSVNAGSDATVNYGSTFTFSPSVTQSNNYSVSWMPADSVQNAAMLQTQTVALYTTNQFVLTITDTLSGCSNSDTIELTNIGGPLTLNTTASADSACINDVVSFTATASGGSGNYSYSWNTGSSTSANRIFTTSITNSAYFYVTVSDGNLQAEDSIFVQLRESPSLSVASVSAVCLGDTASIIATAPTAATYSWSTGNTNSSIAVSPSQDTQYFVTVEDIYGCSSADSITVGVNPLPNYTAKNDTVTCSSDSLELFVLTNASVNWANAVSGNRITVAPSQNSFFGYTVTDTNNCSVADSIEVSVVNYPNAYAGNDSSICIGESVILQGIGGVSQVWNTGQTQNFSAAITADTSFVLTTTNSLGCTSSDTVFYQTLSLPVIDPISDTTVCIGASLIVPATVDRTVSYAWQNGQTQAQLNLQNVQTAFNASLQVTDQNGCSSSEAFAVNLFPAINNSVTASKTEFCETDSSTLSSALSNANVYDFLWNTGDTSPQITVSPSASTTYSLSITDANGCQEVNSVNLIVRPNPNLVVSGDTSICAGNTATVYSAGANLFSYNGGAFTNSTQFTTAYSQSATIPVIGRNLFGCESSDSAAINVNANPTVSLGADTTVCRLDTIEIRLNKSSDVTSYFWSIANVDTVFNYVVTSTNQLSVTVTNANGCVASDSKTIASSSPSYSFSAPAGVCEGNTAQITANGAGNNFLWSTGETQNSINPLITDSTESFGITVTNALGCTQEDSVYVQAYPKPIIALTGDTVCPGETATISASGAAQYIWETNQFSSSITVSPAESRFYSLTAFSSFACTTVDSVWVEVGETPANFIQDTTACFGDSLTVSLLGYEAYQWSSGSTVESATFFVDSVNSDYTITVTNSAGCSGSDTFALNPYPIIGYSVMADSEICIGDTAQFLAQGNLTFIWNNTDTSTQFSLSPTQSEIVNLKTIDVNGCMQEEAFALTVFSLPNLTISGSDSICEGAIWTGNASSVGNITWEDGQQGNTYTNQLNQSQWISATVADTNGCSNTDSSFVTVVENPQVSINAPDSVCENDLAVLSVVGNFNVLWNTGDTAKSISYNIDSVSSFSVTATNAFGCSSSVSKTISLYQNPLVQLNSDTSICEGEFVTLSASGASSYLWNDGTTSATRTVSPQFSTNYTVRGTSAQGCLANDTIVVTVLQNPQLLVAQVNAICEGSSTTLQASGGMQYVWENGATTNATQVSPVVSRFYSVTATSSDGCSSVDSVFVSVLPLPSVSVSNLGNVCQNASPISLNNGSPLGGVYTGQGISQNVLNPQVLNSGTYSLIYSYTSPNGCSASDSSTYMVTAPPVINSFTSLNISSCGAADGQITINASGGSGNLTYSINNGATFQSGNVFNGLSAGNYQLVVSDGSCESAVSSVSLSDPNAPAAPALSGTTDYCEGDALTAITATGSGGTIYWYADALLTSVLDSGNTYTPSLTSGNQTLFAAEAGASCLGAASSITITVSPNPVSPLLADTIAFCDGDVYTLTPQNQVTGTTTYWYNSQGIALDSGNTFTPALAVGSTLFYAQNKAGNCFSSADTLIAQVNTIPNAPAVASVTQLCENAPSDSLFAQGQNIRWYTDNNLAFLTSTENFVIPNPANGDDTLYATQTIFGCESPASVAVIDIVTSPSVDTIITSNPSTCGAFDGSISIIASGGTGNYSYSINGGNTFSSQNVFNSLKNGGYPIIVNDGICNSDLEVRVLNAPGVPVPPVVSSDTAFCWNETQSSLVAAGDSGNTITWYQDAGLNTVLGTGDSLTINQAPGTRTYYATQSQGACESNFNTVQITVYPRIKAKIVGDTVLCAGDSTTLSLNLMGAISWENGSTNQFSSSFSQSDEVTYQFIDANGCVSADSVSVLVNALPTVSLAQQADVCEFDGNVTLTGANPQGGVFSGAFVSQNLFDVGASGAGTFAVQYHFVDANGCENADTSTITINPLPTVSLANLGSYCNTDSSIALTQGTPAGGTYSGMGVSGNTLDLAQLNFGENEVFYAYTDANGCSNSDTNLIRLNPLPSVTLPEIQNICATDSSLQLNQGSPAGGTYFVNGSAQADIDLSASGNYQIVYAFVDTNGCANADSTSFEVYALPEIDLGPDTNFVDSILILGPTANISRYLWNTNDTTSSIWVSQAGEYWLEVENNLGCLNRDSIVLSKISSVQSLIRNDLGVVVYPNPSTGTFILERLNEKAGETTQYKIFNTAGVLIDEGILRDTKNTLHLDVDAGTYFIQLVDKEHVDVLTIIIR